MFRIVDRYVLRQLAKPLITSVIIGLLVLLAERMVRLLDTTLGKKNSIGVVFEMLAYLVPHYLGVALPAALFLGLLFSFNKMSRDSEIDAFLASGIGLHRIAQPVAILSLILAALSVLIVGWLQPHTRYAYRAVLFDVKNVDVFYLAEEGIFMQAGTRTFILDKLNRSAGTFERIFLFDNRGNRGIETVTASNGRLIENTDTRLPVLRLENGHRLQIDRMPNLAPDQPPPNSTVSNFEAADTPLGQVADKTFRPRGNDERELTLPELIALQGNPPPGAEPDQMRAELHKRFIAMLTMPMLPFLAVPFALGRRRNQRTYRFGVALILLVALHEVIEQGAIATRSNGASPWLTMWLPFLAVTAFAAWRFWSVSFALQPDQLDRLIDRFATLIRRFFSSVRTLFSRGEAV
ncbi:YjgP/YjgQ family permease [Nordella sp. HKS 07]|uniref:LptF/LptG family permease n=1 Tax=Nordella sp. HKS 07 TaxID=2712222 RepID=UPI0013E1EE50|nr:LptF/LptG family permease [Nordella sp. HKS 07]QIG46534.1 YjgP/YjgQ family permease [Nordella sp. HKS 07]